MIDEQFSQYVAEAMDNLPEEFREKLKNVAIVIEDEPTPEQRKKLRLGPWGSLYGLYEGVPATIPGEHRAILPDKITLFRLPILTSAHTEQEVKEQIQSTLFHEIGHYFGMSEDQLRKLR